MTGLPPLRLGYPASPGLLARRARLAARWTAEMLAPGVAARDAVVGGVECLMCEPTSPSLVSDEGRESILYFHGGAYRLGSPAGWAHLASRLAATAGYPVIVPDYRLAPEHAFPAALHDAVAVYAALAGSASAGGALAGGDRPGPIVAGDSAGGGLAAALALACRPCALSAPRALILFSPWLDLTCGENAAAMDPFFPREAALEAASLYLQGHDAACPLASPLHGSLAGFPPVLIFAGAEEYVLKDAAAFHERLADAGAAAKLTIEPGMPHAWPVTAPGAEQTEKALREAARFIAAMA